MTSEADPLMMQYRQPVDFLSVRQSLADMLSEQHGIAVSPDHLAITPGNSAALGMIFSNVRLRRARAPGDNRPCVAVVENPTYFLAGAMFSDVGIETRSVSIVSPQPRQLLAAAAHLHKWGSVSAYNVHKWGAGRPG